MKRKRGILQADNQSNSVITEGVAALRKAGFEEEECAAFAEKMLGLLDDGRDLFGVGKEFEYATGKRFGRLTALEPTTERENGYIVWLCRCSCGNIVVR